MDDHQVGGVHLLTYHLHVPGHDHCVEGGCVRRDLAAVLAGYVGGLDDHQAGVGKGGLKGKGKTCVELKHFELIAGLVNIQERLKKKIL